MQKLEKENNLLWELEGAEALLSEDIQAVSYLMQEYFDFIEPKEDFKYCYCEISNQINTIFKSMMYNRDNMRKAIEKINTIGKLTKEGTENER